MGSSCSVAASQPEAQASSGVSAPNTSAAMPMGQTISGGCYYYFTAHNMAREFDVLLAKR